MARTPGSVPRPCANMLESLDLEGERQELLKRRVAERSELKPRRSSRLKSFLELGNRPEWMIRK